MRLNVSGQWALAIVCASVMYSCADSRSPLTPASPSPVATQGAPRASLGIGPAYYDHEPGHPPAPPPEGAPMPDPGQMPPPDAVPAPVPLTVNIVSSFGTGAFVPNPVTAAVGATIVWMNGDVLPHTIVLGDGTIVGDLAPGQSSLPIPLTSTTVSYQCTIHPSMVGQIVAAGTELPMPPDQMPSPAPSPSPDPYSDPYGDGYDDYGYVNAGV